MILGGVDCHCSVLEAKPVKGPLVYLLEQGLGKILHVEGKLVSPMLP
jgi:hypothetical protein